MLASAAMGQTYNVPTTKWPSNITPNAAMRHVWIFWEEAVKDTIIPLYFGQSLFVETSRQTYKVSFDSVKERGQARRAKIDVSWPDTNQILKDHLDGCMGDSIPTGGGYWWPDSLCTKYGTTTDGRSHYIYWMRPEGYQGHGRVHLRDDSSHTYIGLWKIIGDPFIAEGRTQRALFRFKRIGVVPDSVRAMIDTYP